MDINIKKTFLLFSLLYSISSIYAQKLDEGWWTDFDGKIGSSDIQMSLYLSQDGKLIGNYLYTRFENKISLEGNISNNKIELTEYVNGKANGYFSCVLLENNAIEGNWFNADKTKNLGLKLHETSAVGGSPDHRYTDILGTDDEIEQFTKQVKSGIIKDQKEWISAHIEYPISVNVNGKRLKINNKAKLLSCYASIFHQEFKDRIKKSSSCNLFCKNGSVMLGSGEIWVSNSRNSKEGKYSFVISGINN